MKQVFGRPNALINKQFSYCPGCGHGVAHRLVAEVIDELGIKNRTFAVWSVGCSVFAFNFFDLSCILASHGKAPAVATGLSQALRLTKPDSIVFTYQGDGDLGAIGMGEIIHAASRGENFTVIFINNGIFGMTSGQMAPTTVLRQKTTTTPEGRNPELHGYPIGICETLAAQTAPAYLARVALIDPKHIIKAKNAIKKAFKTQIDGKGFSLVEVLSACPVNWNLDPEDCPSWIKNNMMPTFPLGEFNVPLEDKKGEG